MIEEQIAEMTNRIEELTDKVARLEQVANDKWVSVKELAEIMGVAPNTIYIKIRSGEIYASKKLGSPRIPLSQFYKTEDESVPENIKSLKDRIFGA